MTSLMSYRLGLKLGYIPDDPREAIGACQSIAAQSQTSVPAYTPVARVAMGTGSVDSAQRAQYTWPPVAYGTADWAISPEQMTLVPSMTQTGQPMTLTASPVSVPGSSQTYDLGNGWAASADRIGAYTAVSGCPTYTVWGDPLQKPLPTAPC